MVQGEKSSMLTANTSAARTSDPFARKAGYEAVQRMDKQQQTMAAAGKKQAEVKKETNYGSWGPVFQNKQNFASMHLC